MENGVRERVGKKEGGKKKKKRYQFMVVVVVVDMAASSTFPLYGWSIVSTLDTFQKSRNQKHKCSG